MKTAIESLEVCRIAAKDASEESQFVDEMSAILPDMVFEKANTDLETATSDADIILSAGGGHDDRQAGQRPDVSNQITVEIGDHHDLFRVFPANRYGFDRGSDSRCGSHRYESGDWDRPCQYHG